MKNTHPLKSLCAKQLAPIIAELTGEETKWNDLASQMNPPPQKDMGHLAFGVFPLAKTLRKAPPQIAQDINQKLVGNLPPGVETSLQGPYINFKFQSEILGELIIDNINSGNYFKGPFVEVPLKTMIEYSQPNTHKEIHVGHMLNLALGNGLVKILEYMGHPVISATYPGDVGTHVAKCLWYLKHHETTKAPENREDKGEWLGKLYTKAHNLLEDEKGSEKEEKNRAELTAILKELHNGSGDYFKLWKETREWSINQMKYIYDWAHVKFDRWYFESEMDAPSVAYARTLHEKGLLIEDQGAIGADLKEYKLGFCLLIKQDGNGLYSTKDIELARRKFEDEKIEKNIYVVDNRQSHHFKQVFKVLELVGFEQADKCYHLAYDFVELPDGPMSSRKGNYVRLVDLIKKMEGRIVKDFLEKYRGIWPDEEIQDTAKIISRGAILYGMLRSDPNKKIIFDMDEWLKLEGDSGPYLQYVYARIQSLLNKLGKATSPQTHCLDTPFEQDLCVHLSHFNSSVEKASLEYRPSYISNYLYDLCRLFNRFYVECPISKAPSEEIKSSRLALCSAVAAILKQGLALLGIDCPNRM